ncbi:hypothetical protein ACFWD7_32245 [Streptomyces mirabilis]|uniref:hypothetical protein n=1 Tax=Streptomyces mirabilis TaxID=68239 RepID=UPI0021BEA8AB|nr:hypothetical protein [Streptomyces mirabilis]MCT9112512.1 hypothetical protein [Streptomyces mirabilis]
MRELTADLLGAPPSPTLAALAAAAEGNTRLLIQLTALSGKAFELGAVAEPFGQPAGMLLPLVEEATDVGGIVGVGDRLVSPNRCSGRPSWNRCPNRCGRGPAASPYAPASPPAPPRAPWPSNPGRPALAGQSEGDRPGDRHPGQRRPHQQPDRTTRINRSPHTVSYHLRKMFGTLSVRSRSELAGTVRPRLREAP